jgi:hypothetical protein
VIYKGQPVVYKGEPVFEHVYSDNLLIKLLEAGASIDTTGHPYARARHMSTARAQARFFACYQECGRVLMASRWAKVSRAVHYLWLAEDPTYLPRFQAADAVFTQTLKDACDWPRFWSLCS